MLSFLIFSCAVLSIVYLVACAWLRLRYPLGYVTPPPTFVDQLYQLAGAVDEVFNQHAIPYWATCGTLLGAARHGGLIPWDDDVDLCIPVEYSASLEAAGDDLRARGFELYPYAFGGKIGWRADPLKADCAPSKWVYFWRVFLRSHYPYIDIWFVETDGNRMRFASPDWHARVPNESVIFKSEVHPLKRCPFGPLEINCPARTESYLQRAFGDWQTGRVGLGHHVPRIFHILKLFMRRTIPPAEFEPGEVEPAPTPGG
jgi:lipopolysaccharide cholinephosphotransferase